MDAALYNARFLEEIPWLQEKSERSLSEASRPIGPEMRPISQSHGAPRGLSSAQSAPELDINNTSLLKALDESIFSTTTISTATIPTPTDAGEDPFIAPVKAVLEEAQDIPVIYVGDGEAIDAALGKISNAKKSGHSILRVVKRAGASAKKFAHKTKSLTLRREQKSAVHVNDIFDIPAVPHNTPSLGPPPEAYESEECSAPQELVLFGSIGSLESLVATLGSPTTLSAFPTSPRPQIALRSLPSSSASLVQNPQTVKVGHEHGPLLVAKMVLFLPYALIIGFLPFVAPSHLSNVAFAPILGYASSQHMTPLDRYNHHMRLLPCHIGLACGFLGVLGWNLLRTAPLVFVAMNATLLTTTWWSWRDFDAECAASSILDDQDLGVDDMVTIYHLYESTVPYEMRHALRTLAVKLSFRSQDHTNYEGMGSNTQPAPERVRIIVQYDD